MRAPPAMTRCRAILAGTLASPLLVVLLLLGPSPGSAAADDPAPPSEPPYSSSRPPSPPTPMDSSASGPPEEAAETTAHGLGSRATPAPGLCPSASPPRAAAPSPHAPDPSLSPEPPRFWPETRREAEPRPRIAAAASRPRSPFHAFSGEVPAEIWALENLEVLDLEGNGGLSGSLPSVFPAACGSSIWLPTLSKVRSPPRSRKP
uniref:Uncharacterized protein n=1 Tax=Ananas comosus var. bracteatus TaxID=296719 RepID=A0A6V7Q4K7_ANACO|nr:unnamed protein product [Ananas comosus var. bracteatus]